MNIEINPKYAEFVNDVDKRREILNVSSAEVCQTLKIVSATPLHFAPIEFYLLETRYSKNLGT